MAAYPLRFVQRDRGHDNFLESVDIYKFFSPRTTLRYVARVENYVIDVCAVKFYVQKQSGLDDKYFRIVNRGDALAILFSVGSLIQKISQDRPSTSFVFHGSRSVDIRSKKIEPHQKTQRYRIYSELLQRHVGNQTFEHFAYDDASCYVLINKSRNVLEAKMEIESAFKQYYDDLLDIQI